MPISLHRPPPQTWAETEGHFCVYFLKPLKPAALSPVEAPLAPAQRKLQEVRELSGPGRPRQVGSSRGRPLLPWLGVPPEPPAPPPRSGLDTRTQRVGMAELPAHTPLRRVRLPRGGRWRRGRGVGARGMPAAAPIGCAAAPSPRRAPPAVRPAGSRPQPRSCFQPEGGRAGAGPSPRPAAHPAHGDKTRAAARGNPGSCWLRSPGRRGRDRPAASAPAPRTRLREWGAPRGDTQRPGRRGGTFSRAMKRARENPPEPTETFPAPGVAAAAAAA